MSATAASSITWEQYNETGRRLFAEGDLAGAEDAFVAAIAEAERGGGDPLQLASSLGNLAQLKYQQKDHLRAEELFRRSLELREQSLGSDHPSVLTSINNLAALYVSRGALDEAEPLLKRAMGASAKRVESAQTDLGVNLNNLARLYFKRGDYRQAEPLLTQLLTLKRPYGPEHPEVATVLVSLAKVRHALGKPDQAERLWRRVLIVRERQLPASDPAVLQAMDGLSDSLAALGKHAAALDLRERGLKAREDTMGADHPTVTQQRARVDESRAAAAAAVATTTVPVRPRRSAEIKPGASGLTPTMAMPIQAPRTGLTPAASSLRIPTPAAPKPAAPPPAAAVAKEPEPPAKNDLGITEAWADDPELPPPKANRVSEPIKRVSQAIILPVEPPTGELKLEASIAPERKPEPKPEPKVVEPKVVEPSTNDVQLGVTQVFQRPKPTPPPMAAVVPRTPTPPPVSLVEEEEPERKQPRIGFGKEASNGKMIGIAVGAIAAVLIVGAIVVVPKMGHSAPATAPKRTTASAPAAQTPAPTQAPTPAAAAPAPTPVQETPTPVAQAPETPAPAPAQTHEGFSAHMGPAAPPPPAEEPDSNAVKATPHAPPIRLSRGAGAAPAQPDVALPSAPAVNINLDQATKAIDSTTKTKKKPEIPAPSF
jgi:tetratricopeptide (TPR) repeat protein